MSQEEFQTLLRFFKTIGNESRLKILGILATGECDVGELAARLELREPTVSHHLARLKALGLVDMRVEGNNHIYFLDVKALEAMNKDLFTPQSLASLVADLPEDDPRQKVLQQFIQENRIKTIPARHQKRVLVLSWLADQFDWDVRYTEAEISERLKAYHPDYAALRRYLVDEGFMQREHGLYWRKNAAEAAGDHLNKTDQANK